MSITHCVFTKEFVGAIEQKQVAEQDAERENWIVAKADQVMPKPLHCGSSSLSLAVCVARNRRSKRKLFSPQERLKPPKSSRKLFQKAEQV